MGLKVKGLASFILPCTFEVWETQGSQKVGGKHSTAGQGSKSRRGTFKGSIGDV